MLTRWSLVLLGLVALAGTAAACDGLSPGDELQVGTSLCTLGFLVANEDGLYFTTAGHCTDAVDEVASSPDVGDWGRVAFRFLEPDTGAQTDGSPGFDFALIRVDPSAYGSLNPKMCGYEGPTGIYNETPGSGGVQTWGHGLLWGDLGDMGFPTYRRPGVALYNDGDAFYWYGANTPGDSGGAVLSDDGRAIGVLTHLTISPTNTNGGTTLGRGFELAAEKGLTGFRLVLMGEDPVKVLGEMRGVQAAPPQPGTTPGASAAPTAKPAPTNGTAPPPKDPNARNETAQGVNDSIEPAATDGGEVEGASTNKTPFAPLPLLALVLLAALALRKR